MKSIKYIILLVVFSLLFVGNFAYAQNDNGVNKLTNPLGGTSENQEGNTNINSTLKRVVDTALGILGSITLLVFIIGGIMWLTSAGNEQRVSQGTRTMLYAIIGIFVIFSAYAILSALIGVLSGN